MFQLSYSGIQELHLEFIRVGFYYICINYSLFGSRWFYAALSNYVACFLMILYHLSGHNVE